MTVKHIPGVCTVVTGPHIELMRWIAVKHAIALEAIGIRHSGGALRPRFAAGLGLKPRDGYAKFAERCEAKIAELREVADKEQHHA